MTKEQEAAAGMEVARAMILAVADDDLDGMLAAINTADEIPARWAAAYLVLGLREQVLINQKGRAARVGAALRRAAEGIDRDIVETQVAIIVDEAKKRGDHPG